MFRQYQLLPAPSVYTILGWETHYGSLHENTVFQNLPNSFQAADPSLPQPLLALCPMTRWEELPQSMYVLIHKNHNRRQGVEGCTQRDKISKELGAGLDARWGHRGLLVCEEHSAAFLEFVRQLDADLEIHEVIKNPTWAFIDREFG